MFVEPFRLAVSTLRYGGRRRVPPFGDAPRYSVIRAERLERLRRTTEDELDSRLMVTLGAGRLTSPDLAVDARRLTEADVQAFTDAIRGADDALALAFVQRALDDGVKISAIYLELLAPSARELGRLWDRDECDFVDVTLAMGRMQRLLRGLSSVFLADSTRTDTIGSVLLSCVPGEQHTLGIIMVGEFLLREGWRVHVGAPWTEADLLAMVRTEWYDVVGFSVGCESRLATLKRELRRIRTASRNPDVKVLIGGQLIGENPELVERIGADGFATDARQAPAIAASLLDSSRARATVVRAQAANSGDGAPHEAVRRE